MKRTVIKKVFLVLSILLVGRIGLGLWYNHWSIKQKYVFWNHRNSYINLYSGSIEESKSRKAFICSYSPFVFEHRDSITNIKISPQEVFLEYEQNWDEKGNSLINYPENFNLVLVYQKNDNKGYKFWRTQYYTCHNRSTSCVRLKTRGENENYSPYYIPKDLLDRDSLTLNIRASSKYLKRKYPHLKEYDDFSFGTAILIRDSI